MSHTVADTASPTGSPGEDDNKITAEILKVAGVVVLGMIMAILDTTVVNVALPTFQADFEVDAYSTAAWTITGYTLALAAVIPVTGWAADRFGTKRLYLTALTLFTLGSVLCASAWNIEILITFRVLQGLGGGMLMPLGMTIMTRAAGPHRMGRLMAILGVPMLLGPIAGPILGGWLIDSVSWHWIFLINLPLGIIAVVYALLVLPKDAPEPSETFDFVGILLMSPGLALFLYGISSIPGEGTAASPKVLVPGVIGLAMIAAFTVWAFKPQHPLLDLRLFKNRNMTVSTIVMFIFAASFFGAILLVPTYFQQVRGEDVLKSGLLVAPQGIGAMVTMPIAGSLADRVPVGRIVPVGIATIVVGVTGLALSTDPGTPYWRVILFLFLMGLGMGGSMMPIFTSVLRTLREQQIARGTTLINVIQQVASSVGVAVMSVVLTNRQNASEAINAFGAIGEAKRKGVHAPAWATDVANRLGDAFESTVLSDRAHSFATTYWVATGALVVTLATSALLPRKHVEKPADAGEKERVAPPAALH